MKKLYSFVLSLLFILLIQPAEAQIVSFCFAGSEGDEASWPSASEATGIYPTSMTRSSGITASANADRFNSKNWTTGATLNASDYIEFTIAPKPGYGLSISTIALQHQRSVTGPKSFTIRTSHDGFAENATNEVTIPDVNTNQSSTFSFNSTISTTSALVIRIYAYNSEAANGTWGPGESADGNDMMISGSLINLPVRFVHVKGLLKNNKAEIYWTNATESDLLYYVVERSANGRDFSELKKVNPEKNNGTDASYIAIDQQPLNKLSYYRIKAVETTGHILYSQVVKIEVSSTSIASLSFYPNPVAAGSQAMVQLKNVKEGDYVLKVYNASGQLIQQQKIMVNGSSVTQGISLSNWQKGMYVLELQGTTTLHQRFIVQ